MAVQIQHKTFTVDEYHRMIETGILKDDDRVELLNGAIVTMAPIGSRHFSSVNRLDRMLQRLLSDRALVSAQSAVTIRPDSEPQPDIALYRLREDVYASGLPEPADTLLIIEVADSTLSYDRHIKVPLYARARIPELWIVDLVARRVEVYSSPSPEGYRELRYANPGGRIAPAAFPDISLLVDDMLA
ncbi:MAG: Uma2 family endonuclease [Chloroflexi bacterium]|nr:Uma2 family endonuclease [Chloroflexota bacterium]